MKNQAMTFGVDCDEVYHGDVSGNCDVGLWFRCTNCDRRVCECGGHGDCDLCNECCIGTCESVGTSDIGSGAERQPQFVTCEKCGIYSACYCFGGERLTCPDCNNEALAKLVDVILDGERTQDAIDLALGIRHGGMWKNGQKRTTKEGGR